MSDERPLRAAGIRGWLHTTGGIAGILLMVQLLSGILLAFYYVPSVDHAYETVSYMEKVVSSGSWVRSLHHYGSQWLALFLFVHVVQLFLTRAYISRRPQWIAWLLLLGLVMAAAGTGYSLPWDARAFFSTRIAEGLMGGLPFAGRNARLWLLGGNEISTVTLSRLFAVHVLLIPGVIVATGVWMRWGSRIKELLDGRSAIAAGVAFLALAVWSSQHPAPLGPSVPAMTPEYLPRPGSQFLWLYQSLKYLPGALGSLAGLILPGVALLVLLLLPWLKSQKLIGGLILGGGALLITTMTLASYLSDRRDPATWKQLSRQAQRESAWRSETFIPSTIGSETDPSTRTGDSGEPPLMYRKFCINCHGPHGEGARQGALIFPPLLDVSAKPQRTIDDIVSLLKDPTSYGLQPPMRSFSDKLTTDQMHEIAEWVVRLKR